MLTLKNSLFPTINNNIILIAALDWGLGHATRCIPIVDNYLAQNKKIILAGSGMSGKLLKNSFPNLSYYELPSYHIKYAKGISFTLKMLSQIPQILSTINLEHKTIKDIVAKENIQTIISDNRYGVYKNGLQNIIVCHQLNLYAPFLKSFINYFYNSYFKNFDECWIPDFKDVSESLAGNLSHSKKFKIPIKYLGPISRFKKTEHKNNSSKILILLSGPEPQRTLLETILLEQVSKLKQFEWVILRGTDEKFKLEFNLQKNIRQVDFLDKNKLVQEINECSIVVCRAGYTSLMDLTLLHKKAILIPTPGQWEQEYLATWNSKKNNFLFVNQHQLDLKENIAQLIAI